MKTIIRFLTEIFAPRTIEQLRQMPRRTVAARMCVSLAVLPLTLLALLAGGCVTVEDHDPDCGDVIVVVEPVDPTDPEPEPQPEPEPEPDPAPVACSLTAIGDLGEGKTPMIAGNAHGFAVTAWLTPPNEFAHLTRRVIEADATPYSVVEQFLSADSPRTTSLAGDEDGYVIGMPSVGLQNYFFMEWDGAAAGNLLNQSGRAHAIVPDGDTGRLFWSEYSGGSYYLVRGSLDSAGVTATETVATIAQGAYSDLPSWTITQAASDLDGRVALGLVKDDDGGLDKASVILVRASGASQAIELGNIAHGDFTFAYVAGVVATDDGFAVLWSKGDTQSWEIEEHLTLLAIDGTIESDAVLGIPSTYWRHELAWNGIGFGLVSNHAYSSETVFRRLEADGTIAETWPVFDADGWNRPAHLAVTGTTFGIVRESADSHIDFASITCE